MDEHEVGQVTLQDGREKCRRGGIKKWNEAKKSIWDFYSKLCKQAC